MVNESWSKPGYYFEVNVNSKIEFIKNLNQLKNLKNLFILAHLKYLDRHQKK